MNTRLFCCLYFIERRFVYWRSRDVWIRPCHDDLYSPYVKHVLEVSQTKLLSSMIILETPLLMKNLNLSSKTEVSKQCENNREQKQEVAHQKKYPRVQLKMSPIKVLVWITLLFLQDMLWKLSLIFFDLVLNLNIVENSKQ